MYTGFAEIYDELMTDVDYDAWADFYCKMMEGFGIRGGKLAECACGTGGLTLPLFRHGFHVTGVDLSQDMLWRAAQKARAQGMAIPFVRQDMRQLRLHRPMDAVLATCDGVNYLLSAERVRAFFRAAHAAIRPGGALAFDVSSRYKLETLLGDGFFGEEREEAAYLWQNRLDKKRRVLRMDITFFVREADGRYRRFQEEHEQRAHSAAELTAWLEAEGFQNVEVFGDQTFDAPGAEEKRLHFLARRP
mgnify:CR=1 FL=1